MLINGRNKKLTKTLWKYLWNDISIGEFEKLQYVPGNLEGHVHAEIWMNSQEVLKNVLIIQCQLNLRLHKKEVKDKIL